MSPAIRWEAGYSLACIGFGSVVVALLFWWRWHLIHFRALRRDGSVVYLTRQDLDAIHARNPDLYRELTVLNADLEMWHMTADFPPWALRQLGQFWRRRQR